MTTYFKFIISHGMKNSNWILRQFTISCYFEILEQFSFLNDEINVAIVIKNYSLTETHRFIGDIDVIDLYSKLATALSVRRCNM